MRVSCAVCQGYFWMSRGAPTKYRLKRLRRFKALKVGVAMCLHTSLAEKSRSGRSAER